MVHVKATLLVKLRYLFEEASITVENEINGNKDNCNGDERNRENADEMN